MREILFRGKSINGAGEWVYGYYFQKPNPFSTDGKPVAHCISDLPPFGKEIVISTLGQYTGLTDKNGTKIFEGDVVKAVLPPEDMRNGFEWMPGMVSYAEGAFGIAYSKHNFVPFRSFTSIVRFEVIGNIHDNPELLGVRHE
jgi:uncharacterized phage protein (TIGR01671 family)